ncbi:MAG: LCP family protein [Clostridia bacterium]|nr:LCP family protein [Clostridia bacterium]
MGKHEAVAEPRKKHTWLWIFLALLVAAGCYAGWFFTKAPSQQKNPGNSAVTDPDKNPSDPGSPLSGNGSADPGQSTGDPEDPDAPKVSDGSGRQMKKGYYTILLAGTTDDYNTDTLMLCSVDSVNKKINIVSINRDTQIDVKSNNKKINAAYGRAGEEAMCADVTEITGVPVNFYVVVNMNSFKEIVDLIGGVQYDVPIDMVHYDPDPKFDINLKKGDQLLDGVKALQFVRFRSTSENDFGRVNRQKDFLIAAMKQVMAKFSVTQIKDYIEIVNQNLKTNMTVQEMVWFYLNVVKSLDFDEDVHCDTLPYSSTGYYNSVSYVYLSPAQVVEFVNEYLNPYVDDITEDDVHIPHYKD